jgi:enoyl-CoA hydratase/carnithine racemase
MPKPKKASQHSAPSPLAVERDGEIVILRLARPDKRNALSDATIEGLREFFETIPDDVKAVVLAGMGDHFSAGLDLSEVTERSVSEGVTHSRMWHRAFETIEFCTVPVVAVLHGAVVGGGLELASSAHLRVAEESAFYALPEGQRGLFVGGGGSVRIPRLIGVSRMTDMMMTGRVLSAKEGHDAGISHYLVENGAGLKKGIELARRAAANAPLTNFAIIHALPRIADADPAQGYVIESLMAAIAQGDKVAKDRLKAFLEKRAPKVIRS